jgi:hypothetical protein
MAPIVVSPPSDIVDKVYEIVKAEPGLIATYQKACSLSEEVAHDVAKAYSQFLTLKVVMDDFDDRMLVPPGLIEDLWSIHILTTTCHYKTSCEKICGRIIHYDPCFKDNEDFYFGRLTKNIAIMRFGNDLNAKIWMYSFEENDAQEAEEALSRAQHRSSAISKLSLESIGLVTMEDDGIEMVPEIKEEREEPEIVSGGKKVKPKPESSIKLNHLKCVTGKGKPTEGRDTYETGEIETISDARTPPIPHEVLLTYE